MRYCALPLLLTLAFASVQARPKGDRTYEVVPSETRERFIAKLQLYLLYERQNKTDELKTLYNAKTLCVLCLGSRECEEDCAPPMELDLSHLEEHTTVSYRVLEVRRAKYYPEEIEIQLECVKRLKQRGRAARLVKSKVRVYASFERGDWYFSLITIDGQLML